MTKTYNYLDAIVDDINDAITSHDIDFEWSNFIDEDGHLDVESANTTLNDACWDSDFVTGNASGSYTMSKLDAERHLIGS